MPDFPHERRSTQVPEEPEAILPVAARDGALKEIPDSLQVREAIRQNAETVAAAFDKSRPLVRHDVETAARRLLERMGLRQSYAGWTMVAMASAFWRDQVASIPCHRRLLLLPHCLRSAERCPATFNAAGLLCQDCGACDLSDLKSYAEELGYRILIAEGSPAVMQLILGGHCDAVLGVACLDVLERTLDKILLAGIPCMAVPLTRDGCTDTTTDASWVRRMIDTPYRPGGAHTQTYLHLMRCAAQMFEPAELERLVPRLRGGASLAEANGTGLAGIEPIACTEAIAYDFLAAGGKHSRPFITLAVYDALCGGHGTLSEGAQHVAALTDSVRRIALAIEVFHKASLVHDDIEDDDAQRYGRPTLHTRFGKATAINVGDFLIGLGYRMVAAERDALGAEKAADILALFASAHTRLCEGQGAELVWRDALDKRLAPLDALKIYALKTAPAFEAAIVAGMRLAGPIDAYRETASRYARHLGVAYQMINDLDDWYCEQPGGHHRGTDLLGGRPTVLWALAMASLQDADRQTLDRLAASQAPAEERIAQAAELYAKADVYRQCDALIARHHQRAGAAADQLQSEPLRRFLNFLSDAILDRRPLAVSEGESTP